MKLKEILWNIKSYRHISNFKTKRILYKNNKNEAIKKFEQIGKTHGDLKEYLKLSKKGLFSFDEYEYQYKLYNKSDDEKEKFISQFKIRLLYNIKNNPLYEDYFWNKYKFIKKYSSFIKRAWLYIGNATFEDFSKFLSRCDIIAKSCESCCGNGIIKIQKETNIDRQLEIYNKLKGKDIICEECIYNEDSIRRFHQNSLNTIRIVTVTSKYKNINILGSFIRFGVNNNIVDNGGNGGILALIDINTGIIKTPAYDKNGNEYTSHPNTNIKFVGFKIKRYNEMIKICKEAAKLVPEIPIIGWDIVLNDKNQIEIIEGNHRPDAYGLQMPTQEGNIERLNLLLNSKI